MTPLQQFKKKLEDELMRHFQLPISECFSDEQVERAFEDKETVDELVKWYGNKYDLTDFVDEPYLR